MVVCGLYLCVVVTSVHYYQVALCFSPYDKQGNFFRILFGSLSSFIILLPYKTTPVARIIILLRPKPIDTKKAVILSDNHSPFKNIL